MALRPLADPRFRRFIWLVVGLVGWAGLASVGAALRAEDPRQLGFDLELILRAGRRVAAGLGPYDPALVAGTAQLEAADLFFSYPPPVAQAAALLVGLPTLPVLAALGGIAAVGFALVAARVAGRFAPWVRPADAALAAVAVLPLLYPMAAALLFGNVDALYPLLYGAMLLGVLAGGRGGAAAAGLGLVAATITKVHPAGMGLWFAVRGLRDRRSGSAVAWAALGVAVAAGLGVLAVSLLVGGPGPWEDYLSAVRTASGAELVVRGNVGPAAQIALLASGGVAGPDAEALARGAYLPIVAVAALITAWAAWRLDDPVGSLAVAATASLVVLPVTWYHYPTALLPFAAAAVFRSLGSAVTGRVVGLVVAAGAAAALSILAVVTVWVAVGLVLVAVRLSASRPAQRVA